ncbi:CPBP family intramembrane glutamic endopeptidase [Halobacterium yunchengense]|uniref:CPBP family intramembrane glutamic endopeptidase n=1 Tax=Halobacterium yunchengense TaxID=3108497 RepID=UPI0030097CB5
MAPHWLPFAAFAVLLTAAVVALTWASRGVLESRDADGLTPRSLLVQVSSSQAAVGLLVLAAAWTARIPVDAFRIGASWRHAAVGAAVGVLLAAGNEAAMRVLDEAGLGYDEDLRAALTPADAAGWLVLFGVALPVVAGVEELLFRGVLVGAFAAGFGASPWLLAAASSVAFGAAHTAQGAVGVAVTTALGFALAAAYVLTGSLLAAVVAHYVVNAAEFALHARD